MPVGSQQTEIHCGPFGVDILLRSAPVQNCHPESPRPSQTNRRGVRDVFLGLLLSAPSQMSTERLAIEDSGQQAGFRVRKKKKPRNESGRAFLQLLIYQIIKFCQGNSSLFLKIIFTLFFSTTSETEKIAGNPEKKSHKSSLFL